MSTEEWTSFALRERLARTTLPMAPSRRYHICGLSQIMPCPCVSSEGESCEACLLPTSFDLAVAFFDAGIVDMAAQCRWRHDLPSE